MKRLVCAVIFLVLLGLNFPAYAIRGVPRAEETITVSTVAIGITTDLCGVGNRERALLQVKDEQIFYTLHSTTATPDSGDYLGRVGDVIELEFPGRFRAIRAGAVDALVKVTCFQ